MRLYGYWRSSATYRVRIACALKGLDYAYQPVNLLKGEQTGAAYRRVSPQGLVPALVTADGETLTQSLAIIAYLEETNPNPPLLPATPVLRARARAIAMAIACEAQPFGNLRMLNYLKDEVGFDDARRLDFLNRFPGAALRSVNAMVEHTAGRFCVGDAPGLADCFLVPQLYAARRFNVDLSGCEALLTIDAECAKLEAFRRAHPDRQPDAVKA
jgi:maleylacetoacetate isomerase